MIKSKITEENFKNGKIGNEMRVLRESKGVSKYRLSKLLSVSSTAIMNWENGISIPSADKFELFKNVISKFD